MTSPYDVNYLIDGTELEHKFFSLLNEVNKSKNSKYSNGVFNLLSPKGNKDSDLKTLNWFRRTPSDLSKWLDNYNSAHRSEFRNWYMTINSMKTWKRNRHNIRKFNGFYLDIDCHFPGAKTRDHVKTSTTEFIQNEVKVLNKANLPIPTVLIGSGHGFYLIYLLNQGLPNNDHKGIMLGMWTAIEDRILKNFNQASQKVFGEQLADSNSTDASRVLRIPGTLNEKDSNHPVPCLIMGLDSHNLYSLKYWYDKYPVPKQVLNREAYFQHKNTYNKVIKPNKNKQSRRAYSRGYYRTKRYNRRHNTNRTPSQSFHVTDYKRLQDLGTLLKLRKFNMNGYRDLFIFLYSSVILSYFNTYTNDKKVTKDNINYYKDLAANKIAKINSEFTKPLDDQEMNHVQDEVKEAGIKLSKDQKSCAFSYYLYNNEDIIDRLDISMSEQSHMKTLRLFKDNHGKVRTYSYKKALDKAKKNRKHQASLRANQRSSRDNKIIWLRKIKHFSYRTISKIVHASKSLVGNLIHKVFGKQSKVNKQNLKTVSLEEMKKATKPFKKLAKLSKNKQKESTKANSVLGALISCKLLAHSSDDNCFIHSQRLLNKQVKQINYHYLNKHVDRVCVLNYQKMIAGIMLKPSLVSAFEDKKEHLSIYDCFESLRLINYALRQEEHALKNLSKNRIVQKAQSYLHKALNLKIVRKSKHIFKKLNEFNQYLMWQARFNLVED